MPTVKKDNYKVIRTLQIVRLVALVAAAAGLIALLKDVRVPLNAMYMTRDSLNSQAQTVFVPGLRSVLDAPIAYMTAIGFLVSALIAAYRITKGENAYQKQVKKGSDTLKWLDLGISSAIMIEIVALLAGVSDPSTVKVMAGLIVATCALGWLADRQNTGAKQPEYSAYIISVLTGLLPWLIVGQALLLTALYGDVRLPWYSYALAATALIGFTTIAANQLLHIRQHKGWKKYPVVERNFLIIDTVLKLVFAGVLILGLKG